MNILITGGSGLVGRNLSMELIRKGHKVKWLSRKEDFSKSIPRYKWDVKKNEIDLRALEDIDAIVHLAGKSVGEGRWTNKAKKEILESRIQSTKTLISAINSMEKPPEVVVCASAIGIYGDTGQDWVDEDADIGEDFLADVVRQWEEEMDRCKKSRLVKLRLGVVLTPKGGALEKMVLPIKMGVGSALGDGNQWVSWVSLNDIIRLIIHTIENQNTKGVYNATAPNPLTNDHLMQKIAKIYHRPYIFPKVPAFMLKLALGESASLVLNSNKVKTNRFDLSFEYHDKDIESVIS